ETVRTAHIAHDGEEIAGRALSLRHDVEKVAGALFIADYRAPGFGQFLRFRQLGDPHRRTDAVLEQHVFHAVTMIGARDDRAEFADDCHLFARVELFHAPEG